MGPIACSPLVDGCPGTPTPDTVLVNPGDDRAASNQSSGGLQDQFARTGSKTGGRLRPQTWTSSGNFCACTEVREHERSKRTCVAPLQTSSKASGENQLVLSSLSEPVALAAGGSAHPPGHHHVPFLTLCASAEGSVHSWRRHTQAHICKLVAKFADDTTVIGLIRDNDESAYRWEVEQLAPWCDWNNLELNTLKTVEMVVDFKRNPSILLPLTVLDNTVSTVETFKFLGCTISQDLKWTANIKNIIK
ncbi:uncharacterized protein LOC131202551 [Ahaetulla prasina]|uniref:uncharacterized protein LOC131202551 n=1 Tax=Ahaetulla prasina TaxID=499056 RepID=UPI002646FD6A|nr:uncharacterized protein LOC131202551 [Ahaetulla prasina]